MDFCQDKQVVYKANIMCIMVLQRHRQWWWLWGRAVCTSKNDFTEEEDSVTFVLLEASTALMKHTHIKEGHLV